MKFLQRHLRRLTAAGAVLFSLAAPIASADFVGGAEYLVGRDRLSNIATGIYAGLQNPNAGRPTLLWGGHADHFHSIGAYTYTGTPPDQTIRPTNTNNRLPEISSQDPPLTLTQGTGTLYGDKLVNKADPAVEYSSITFKAIDVLFDGAPGSPEAILRNSSNGRWSGSMAGSRLAIELLTATAGLSIGDADTLNLFESNSIYELGDGADLNWTPVFWVDLNAAPGTYSAQLRFLDLGTNGNVLSAGGTFNFDFAPAPVPLPGALWMALSAIVSGSAFMRRRNA